MIFFFFFWWFITVFFVFLYVYSVRQKLRFACLYYEPGNWIKAKLCCSWTSSYLARLGRVCLKASTLQTLQIMTGNLCQNCPGYLNRIRHQVLRNLSGLTLALQILINNMPVTHCCPVSSTPWVCLSKSHSLIEGLSLKSKSLVLNQTWLAAHFCKNLQLKVYYARAKSLLRTRQEKNNKPNLFFYVPVQNILSKSYAYVATDIFAIWHFGAYTKGYSISRFTLDWLRKRLVQTNY